MVFTDFELCVHLHTFTVPEGIQVWLAEPLFIALDVELVLSTKLHALIVFDVGSELIEGDHRLPE